MWRRPGRSRTAGWALAAIALVGAACSNAPPEETGPSVMVFGPWREEAAESFRESMVAFEEASGIDVIYVGTSDFATALLQRARDGYVPDVAIFPEPGLMDEGAESGMILPLPPETATLVDANYRQEVADLGVLDGVDYGVPYRINAKSLIWYRPDEFASRGYQVPETWPGLQALARQMMQDGTTPWCIGVESFGADGWVGTDWVEDIVLREWGTEVYDNWVEGEVSFLDEPIEASFFTFGDMTLVPGATYGGRRVILTTATGSAMDPMFLEPAQCLVHRQASFHAGNLPTGTEIGPDGDVDVFVMPSLAGGNPPLLVGGVVAAAFEDRPEVWALLDYLATPESGEEWAKRGNYVSPHLHFDKAHYASPFDRRVDELIDAADVVRFDASDRMPTVVGSGTFFEAIMSFIADGNLQAALELAQSGFDAVGAYSRSS